MRYSGSKASSALINGRKKRRPSFHIPETERRYLNVARGGYKMAPFSNPHLFHCRSPRRALQRKQENAHRSKREALFVDFKHRRLQARYTNWFLPISTTSTHKNSWFRASVNCIVSQVELLQVSSHLFCWILRLIRSRIL